jgi:hypothetical protein
MMNSLQVTTWKGRIALAEQKNMELRRWMAKLLVRLLDTAAVSDPQLAT